MRPLMLSSSRLLGSQAVKTRALNLWEPPRRGAKRTRDPMEKTILGAAAEGVSDAVSGLLGGGQAQAEELSQVLTLIPTSSAYSQLTLPYLSLSITLILTVTSSCNEEASRWWP